MGTAYETTLVKVHNDENNNKFYRVTLDDNGVLTKTWGRIGGTGQTKTERGDKHSFDRAVAAKLARGYSDPKIVSNAPASSGGALAQVARTALVADKNSSNPELDRLIDTLVAMNRHAISVKSGGLITMDDDGVIKTPLGLVSQRSVDEARVLLDQLETLTDAAFVASLEAYLRVIPQKVSSRAGWATRFFDSSNTVQSQRDFLDQLEASLEYADTRAKKKTEAANRAPGDDSANDDLFRLKIGVLDAADPEFKRISDYFESSKNSHHTASRMKVRRIYTVTDSAEQQAKFDVKAKALRNVREFWHGTRVMNVLNILHKGLYVPPVSGTTVITTARMFGDGVYFSEQSSKSLGYTDNQLWTHGRGSAAGAGSFLFLASVVMGSEYRPARNQYNKQAVHEAHRGVNKFGAPWNSINVKGGTGGVRNHEAIVWDTDQISLRYLLEIG